MTARLDNFTDAAFAFAVTLLVIGGTGAPQTFDQLVGALGDIPAFAFGFAVVAMFWTSHLRWRVLRGDGDAWSILLTLLLIFLTLIYVQPLRGMSAAVGEFFTGQGEGFGGSLSGLFAVYGTGFITMSLTMAGLFREALRNKALDAEGRAIAKGEAWIWAILAATGIVSLLISLTRWGEFAAMLYPTLPFTIGLFVWRFDWTGGGRKGADAGR
ncbi:MAG: TMEM175 family protein [Sphingosinicella sp.]